MMAKGSSSITLPPMFGPSKKDYPMPEPSSLSDSKCMLALSDELSSRELSHLVFLCKDVVLPQSVTNKIRSFPELVKALENSAKRNETWKLTKDMNDYLILFDLLELIGRNDLKKKIKEYGKIYSQLGKKTKPGPTITSTLMLNTPLFVFEERKVDVTEENLVFNEILMKGDYCDFWRGQVNGGKNFIIEVYKASRSSDMQQSFAAQGDIQCRLKHERIVEVVRIFRSREPPWIVLEWMGNGILSTFLRSNSSQKLNNVQLINFSAQIANAMSYIEEKGFAHCNLRADSVFVTADCKVKVGGFCLARKLLSPEKVCELEEDVRLSLRWSSLDVIRYHQVTEKSDVWSFGVLLLELFAKGETPYQGMETKEVLTRLKQGYRHPQPDNCPKGIYHLMKCCWNMPENLRPSFAELKPHLENYKDEKDYGGNPRLIVANTAANTNSGFRRSIQLGKEINDDDLSLSMRDKRASYARYIDQSLLFPGNRGSCFPPSDDALDLPRSDVKLVEQIGAGEFGEVWKAELKGEGEVAVKMFIPTRTEPENFLDEAKIMTKFNHPHIVSLIGVCSVGFPIFIITELMSLGNLLDYLRNDGGVTLRTPQLLDYAAQVADAMTNVETMNCIHRDIAARNVLMANVRTVKLADFGLSRSLISNYYQMNQEIRLPARWTAPEAAKLQKFTIKSDVWSFGVLLIELMTFGEVPYSDMNNLEVLGQVKKGYKHPQPVDTCSDEIYEVMISCWRIKPDKRPSFLELFNVLKSLIEVYDRNPVTLR